MIMIREEFTICWRGIEGGSGFERLMEGLDGMIERLLEGGKIRGKKIQLAEPEIRLLCTTAKDVFLSQPNLLELEAPINVCGM